MEEIGNYFKIKNQNVDIVPEKGTKVARYYLNCFDRELVLLLNDSNLESSEVEEIEKELDKYYNEWLEDDHFEGCEEYMISKLDKYYRNSIVAVIYVGDDDNE